MLTLLWAAALTPPPTFAQSVAAVTALQTPQFAQTDPSPQPQLAPTEACPAELAPGFNAISAQQIEADVSILAGENFEGRGTGQKGYKKAAHWVAGQLAEIGIEPIFRDGNYFQSVPLQQKVPISDQCYLRAAGGLQIPAAGNIGLETYSANPSVLGRLIFVRCPQKRFNVPAGISLRDAIVVYWVDDDWFKYASQKIESHRPAAMLRVVASKPKSVNQPTFPGQPKMAVKGSIFVDAADQLLQTITRKEAQGNNDTKPTDWSAKAGQGDVAFLDSRNNVVLANPVRTRAITAPNVVGVLPGSDPTLRHEHIIIGAHLDHIGVGSNGVFYGADDNASGCSAVLSIAAALIKNPVRPKRSIVFTFFAAEEIGLKGSEYYCQRPILPLKDVTCMLNIDMVGRNESSAKETAAENEDSIHLIGARQGGSGLHNLVLQANQHIGFRFELDEEKIFNRSDQFNFYQKGVGVAFLFGGFHPDYHQTSDRAKRLNYQKIQAAARLFYLTVFKADQHGSFSVPIPNPTSDQPQQPQQRK